MSENVKSEGNAAVELRPDIDLNDPKLNLKIAAERLSIVRYVFLVQIEDGIASAAQRASLEYADAVLIGWPENESPEIADLTDSQLRSLRFAVWCRMSGTKTWVRSIPRKTIPPLMKSSRKPKAPTKAAKAARHEQQRSG